jgi:hypothetical protein
MDNVIIILNLNFGEMNDHDLFQDNSLPRAHEWSAQPTPTAL